MEKEHVRNKHWDSPTRSRLRREVKLLQAYRKGRSGGRLPTNRQLFEAHGIPIRSGYNLLASKRDSRHLDEETRGRKRKLSSRDIRYLEQIIRRGGFDGKALTWDELAAEAGLPVSGATVRKELGTMSYRRCTACPAAWTAQRHAERRVEYARVMLERYPMPEDWKKVRFSHVSHASRGEDGGLCLVRQPGERLCPDCDQKKKKPGVCDTKRAHFWGVIGYDYKSSLFRYDCDDNQGTMTQKVYITLLERECAKWPSEWVLEEDGESYTGIGKSNPVRLWKEQHQRQHHYNCPESPDLSLIDHAWQAPKPTLQQPSDWTEEQRWELCQQGWDGLSQKVINAWCLSMPERLQTVIAQKGQLTGV